MIVDCPDCEVVVNADVHCGYEWPPKDSSDTLVKVYLASCPLCSRPIIVGDEFFGTYYRSEHDEEGEEVWSGPFRF